MGDHIGLEEAIRAVRSELIGAMRSGEKEPVQFRVQSVDLEFQVVVTKEVEGSAKVQFWVVQAGASGSLSSQATHIVRVTLNPVTPTGETLAVRSAEPVKPG